MALAMNLMFHARTKHICVHHHFICDCINNEDIELEYVPTADQVANVFTKGLPEAKHMKFATMMGISSH
jgi:histone deacetylase 1/2